MSAEDGLVDKVGCLNMMRYHVAPWQVLTVREGVVEVVRNPFVLEGTIVLDGILQIGATYD